MVRRNVKLVNFLHLSMEPPHVNIYSSIIGTTPIFSAKCRSYTPQRKIFRNGHDYSVVTIALLILGHCVFCEGVTTEVFIKDNIVDFARNLPLNSNFITKRRGSRSPSKDTTKDNNSFPRNDHLNEALLKETPRTEELEKVLCNVDSYSSDDESDSVDIGFKRRKRKKARASRETPGTVSQRRIRSLSEAIIDIEARNKAATEEMNKRAIRMKSDSGSSTGVKRILFVASCFILCITIL